MGRILRVASYNLRDFKDDVDAAARVVRAINPDVLCLQEVPRRLFSGLRIARFADRCDLRWSGGHRGEGTSGIPVGRGGSGGTTVMSRPGLDVSNVEHRPLKVARLNRPRGYAVMQVRLPGGQDVRVASLHLSLDPAERVAHITTVLAALPADQALVVAGDMNEERDGAAWKALALRLTMASDERPTFPAKNPGRCLDVIFTASNLTAVPGDPVELSPADLVAATDHLPVWVDLELS
jgi:endonuclease/exonuclease/phosphatase family metal-dependent hydrolase